MIVKMECTNCSIVLNIDFTMYLRTVNKKPYKRFIGTCDVCKQENIWEERIFSYCEEEE